MTMPNALLKNRAKSVLGKLVNEVGIVAVCQHITTQKNATMLCNYKI